MNTIPETVDLILEPRWLLTVEPEAVLTHHVLLVHHGRIAAILPTAQARQQHRAGEWVRLERHVLMPGLINLHTHAAMSLMRGIADDLPLMTWLQSHIWPTEARHVSPAFVHDGTQLACAEMLLGGITCFNDMYFFPDAAASAVDAVGMRAVLGITTIEFPTAYASDADDYLNKGLAVRDQWRAHPRIRFCLAPHAPYTVSDATFARVLTLSEQLNLPIHCHVHETAQEIADSLRTTGRRPLARLDALGLLGPGFIGVHAVHLDAEDEALLAARNVHVAHCPTSNLKLASGLARME